MGISHPSFTAVVLAADRFQPDAVAQAAGVGAKAFAPVNCIPMVLRVIDALQTAQAVDAIVLCGPPADIVETVPDLIRKLENGAIQWVANRPTPSTSAALAMQQIPAEKPVLLTTADHALLRAEIVDFFCRESIASGHDVLVGLARYQEVMAAFPGMRRTATRFQDGPFCGCNLFGFPTARGRSATAFWRQVEQERKRPWRMISRLGLMTVMRYLAGKLSLQAGLTKISRRLGIQAGAIILPYPEAAVDVDTVADWHFAQRIAQEMPQSQIEASS
jgi:CTP:molybdopterin cytidylyltransferase MocA